jgi:hypothetical protein
MKFPILPEFQELFFSVIQNFPESEKSRNKILGIPQILRIRDFTGIFGLEPHSWFSFWHYCLVRNLENVLQPMQLDCYDLF